MSFTRDNLKKRVRSSYHLNDNIEEIFQGPSVIPQFHFDSTFDQAPRAKRLYEEVLKEQEFLRNVRTVWLNKLECLKEDARLLEKMQRCTNRDLVNVPRLFENDGMFEKTENTSTINNNSTNVSNCSSNNNSKNNSLLLETPSSALNISEEGNEPFENTSAVGQLETPSSSLVLPDIDLSVLGEVVDENDDNAVRKALDLMLKQFGDSL